MHSSAKKTKTNNTKFPNRKLGQAVPGVTCNMIDGISQSDTVEAAQTIAKSFTLLSRTQVRYPSFLTITQLLSLSPHYSDSSHYVS